MDYTISNNAKLFEELIAVLGRHHEEPGVAAALDDLRSAKVNYGQRSIDHMINALVLTGYDLVTHPLSKELQDELQAVIQGYVTWILQAGSRLGEMAQRYEKSGGRLLSDEEILAEMDDRHGSR
jgi:hypothetical protein